MPKRTVTLTDYFDRSIDERVASGRYKDASDVVQVALRLLDRHEREFEAKLERLRAAINVGLQEAARGEVEEIDIDRLSSDMDELEAEAVAARRRKGAA